MPREAPLLRPTHTATTFTCAEIMDAIDVLMNYPNWADGSRLWAYAEMHGWKHWQPGDPIHETSEERLNEIHAHFKVFPDLIH